MFCLDGDCGRRRLWWRWMAINYEQEEVEEEEEGGTSTRAMCIFAVLLLSCRAQRESSQCGSRFLCCCSPLLVLSRFVIGVDFFVCCVFLFESARRVQRCRFHSPVFWCFQFQLFFCSFFFGSPLPSNWLETTCVCVSVLCTTSLDVVGCLLPIDKCVCRSQRLLLNILVLVMKRIRV